MLRTIACAFLAVGLVALAGTAAAQPQKSQMVKGTIKSVDVENGVLVVNQKVKDETVERQLDIKSTTEFTITIGNEKKDLKGRDGLEALKDAKGAQVKVKCDKDVNVLEVNATIKK